MFVVKMTVMYKPVRPEVAPVIGQYERPTFINIGAEQARAYKNPFVTVDQRFSYVPTSADHVTRLNTPEGQRDVVYMLCGTAAYVGIALSPLPLDGAGRLVSLQNVLEKSGMRSVELVLSEISPETRRTIEKLLGTTVTMPPCMTRNGSAYWK